MPNNPYTKKRGSPKSYMRKATVGQLNQQALVTSSAIASSGGGSGGGAGKPGNDGEHGWSPALACVADGERRVLQLAAWIGGTGNAPAGAGMYLGAGGLVAAIGDATDIRGAQGEPPPEPEPEPEEEP